VELLLEIGTEEIPAGYLAPAFDYMRATLPARLVECNLLENPESPSVHATGTPRRLTVVADNIRERQPDTVEEITGPPFSAAYDKDGAPTRAATGFASKTGVDVSELEKVETAKGPYVMARVKKPGRPAQEVLAEILPRFITSIPWRKSMRWDCGDIRFARPIRWILAILDGSLVEFELDGLKSESATRGHRFVHPGLIEVKNFGDYKEKLLNARVMADHDERLKKVIDGINEKASELGGVPACLEELFSEIADLVEWPVIIGAKFPERYLELPELVLIAAMTGHQRYVPLRDAGEGKTLLPHFITVANTPVKDISVVARGNERVLNARLADAGFFYKTDCKKSLEEHARGLSDVLYIRGMGSYADKAARLENLSAGIARRLEPDDPELARKAARAAKLAKADLVTHMVGEFPGLQGQMGGIYARVSGEEEEVARAIEEHYLPRSASDIERGVFPETPAGCIVSIADKLDSLAACFALGLTPSGDQDPYALRRSVLGVLAIIKARGLHLNIPELIEDAVEGVVRHSKIEPEKLVAEILDFVTVRVRTQILNEGMAAPDTVEAVTRSGVDDYIEVIRKAEALTRFRERPDFEDLATSFRRVGNILENLHGDNVDESLFVEEAEKQLWEAFQKKRIRVEELAEKGEYYEALEAMAELRPAVDRFFDHVLVNDPDDPGRRRNRHSMLYAIHRTFMAVADFSAIARPGG